eukprot:m.127580 g.127580  ORF g.127580 m.127580 type:complete len:142 (+) comp14709_c1_seq10:960-1385(+)
MSLADALTHNTTLLELDLSSNRITEWGMLPLFEALLVNTSLHTLKLGLNAVHMDNETIFPSPFSRALAAVVTSNKSLVELNLHNISLNHTTVRLLAEAMPLNTALQSFEFTPSVDAEDLYEEINQFLERNALTDTKPAHRD